MTRKDYEAVAAVIKARRDTEEGLFRDYDHNRYAHTAQGVGLVASDLARLFAIDNPRFDREKFLTACGLDVLDVLGSKPVSA